MAEGSETPGGPGPGAQSGGLGPEGRGRGSEGDLLAERRARRAVESGDAALIRRAEAAEATVRTLEAHVASLQHRLREAEADERRMSELIHGDQLPAAAERRSSTEQELRRSKQREYAEQRLRVEAEDRYIDLERESRLEIERLNGRLSASERSGRALGRQLESVQESWPRPSRLRQPSWRPCVAPRRSFRQGSPSSSDAPSSLMAASKPSERPASAPSACFAACAWPIVAWWLSSESSGTSSPN